MKYFSRLAASSASHRSGLNSFASSPQIFRSRWNTQGLMESVVPSGK